MRGRMRTVEWDDTSNRLRMIDQRLLPGELLVVAFDDYHQVVNAIQSMVVRGAPAIGATAAFALALAAHGSSAAQLSGLRADLESAADEIGKSRPTAVNLRWALDRVMRMVNSFEGDVSGLKDAVLQEAKLIADEDVEINRRMAEIGSVLLNDGDTVIHHCNTGALAAVDWGTALGVIRMAHEQGKKIHVLVDETRPRLQGARLTAWELQQYGISYEIIADGAAGHLMKTGIVNKAFFGADRVAANGDVANKIGTYMLALAAFDNGIPTYCVAPISTIDLNLSKGNLIPIEERPASEVLSLQVNGEAVTPPGAHARNPAFDITPNNLITAIVTENGIALPPFQENLKRAVLGK